MAAGPSLSTQAGCLARRLPRSPGTRLPPRAWRCAHARRRVASMAFSTRLERMSLPPPRSPPPHLCLRQRNSSATPRFSASWRSTFTTFSAACARLQRSPPLPTRTPAAELQQLIQLRGQPVNLVQHHLRLVPQRSRQLRAFHCTCRIVLIEPADSSSCAKCSAAICPPAPSAASWPVRAPIAASLRSDRKGQTPPEAAHSKFQRRVSLAGNHRTVSTYSQRTEMASSPPDFKDFLRTSLRMFQEIRRLFLGVKG